MQKSFIRCALALALCAGALSIAHAAPAATTPAATIGAEQFKKVAGDYQLAPGMLVIIFQKDGKLMAQATGQNSFELFADSATSFHATVADIKIAFTIGSDGIATDFVLTQNGRSMPAATRIK